jgi:hypothetical protein
MSTHYVVDYGDDFILYTGNLEDCEQVVQEGYGGLQVSSYQNLSVKMKNQLAIAKMLEEAYKKEDK